MVGKTSASIRSQNPRAQLFESNDVESNDVVS